MSALVVEESMAAAIPAGALHRIHVVPRDRRRDGSWPPVAGDAVVATLDAAGSEAVVLARPPDADPGAAALPALAGVMERDVVRLPRCAAAAAWVVGVAMAGDEGSPPPLRALQALAGAADRLETTLGEDELRLPAIRPSVLVRWARSGWRPCDRCRGGGLPGARCGRCGAPVGGGGA